MPSTIQFQEVPIGQHFEFRGRRYRKLALNMAGDEDRNGTIFMNQTGVLPDPPSQTAQPTNRLKDRTAGRPRQGLTRRECAPNVKKGNAQVASRQARSRRPHPHRQAKPRQTEQ
jgi:hypothetical protein